MRHRLKQLFSKAYRDELRMAADIAAYVDALPQCSKTILLASPVYDKHEYNCAITMPANELLAWSLVYVDEPAIMPWHEEVVRQSLPLWLEKARQTDGEPTTKLPAGAFKAINRQIADWVKNDTAYVWCYSCKHSVSNINMTKENEMRAGKSYSSWTDLWRCPAGHKLYAAKSEMRITYTSRDFD